MDDLSLSDSLSPDCIVIQLLQDVDDKYDVSDPGRLIIRNTTLDDSGMYVCTLSNTYGSTNGLAHLAVQTGKISTCVSFRTSIQTADCLFIWFYRGHIASCHRRLVAHCGELRGASDNDAHSHRFMPMEATPCSEASGKSDFGNPNSNFSQANKIGAEKKFRS